MKKHFVGGEFEASGSTDGYVIHGAYINRDTDESVVIFRPEHAMVDDALRFADALWQSGPYNVVNGMGAHNLENVESGGRWHSFHVNPAGRSFLVIEGFGGADRPSAVMWSAELLDLAQQHTNAEEAALAVVEALVLRSDVAVPPDVPIIAAQRLAATWAPDFNSIDQRLRK